MAGIAVRAHVTPAHTMDVPHHTMVHPHHCILETQAAKMHKYGYLMETAGVKNRTNGSLIALLVAWHLQKQPCVLGATLM